MKKIRYEILPGGPARSFHIFDHVEELKAWMLQVASGTVYDASGAQRLLLEPNGFMDAELTGYEYVHAANRAVRLNRLRIGLAQRTNNASGLIVRIKEGWTTDALLRFDATATASMKEQYQATWLRPTDDQLDLALLFAKAELHGR